MTTNNAAANSPFNPSSFAEAWEKISGQVRSVNISLSANGKEDVLMVDCFDGDMTITPKRVELWFEPKEGGVPKRFILNKKINFDRAPKDPLGFVQWFATKYLSEKKAKHD